MAHAPLPPRVETPGPVRLHSEGDYRYEMQPDLSVLVFKGGNPSYSITSDGECECPGFRHRGRCKHSAQASVMVSSYLTGKWTA